ncbi:carbohydrate ABC transporter permease [Ruminiclostridium cellobioparum]|uniref:ABC-type sugar transport system, permease component n=1 Tax=Ruminiclostridium cellobioparum subsp. termitidis CT1112 TaxID=1195236 RepID=S0FGE0_RUMCE|nr:carbohydrate ABC transporter permease [Ruminiclostridium cellobioparum]EMS70062.1 ABC-type sugar transport system, permease component [Ruminiclostridium cellobioparum subsp. termitidis CT1112]
MVLFIMNGIAANNNVKTLNINKKLKGSNLRDAIGKTVITLILFAFSLVMVLPFIWMISTSMKYEVDVFTYPIQWIPAKFRIIENYREVWFGDAPFTLYYFNSIKVTVITTVLSLLISSMAAFAFSKLKFPGRDKIFLLIIATMIIPDQVTLIPRFLYFKWLHLFDTHICLIISMLFSQSNIFFITQFMKSLPAELSDSAKIDGAGTFRTFWNIILPLTKPAIATMAIIKFIWSWNDYQNVLIFITNAKLFTIQIGVRMFTDKYGSFYSLIMAASVSAIIPLFIVFALGQKYIIEGLTAGSVKG